jgi:FRG domain
MRSNPGNMPSREDVICKVFEDLQFPFLSANGVALAKFLSHPNSYEGCHLALIFSPPRADRNWGYYEAFRGLIRQIEVPTHVAEFLGASASVTATAGARDALQALLAIPTPAFSITPVADGIRWDEVSPWPAAYSDFLMQLKRIVQLFAALTESRQNELSESRVGIVDHTSRVLPTRFHYAAASLGAWLGGAINLQYFSLFASKPQLHDANVDKQYAIRIGYDAQAAEALSASGLISIPMTLALPLFNAQEKLGTPGALPILGGISVDEINAANFPTNGILQRDAPDVLPGILLDKYYRAPFFARRFGDQALFGAKEVLRDHYDSFYKNVPRVDLLRCKHYCAPIIEIGSMDELRSLIAEIPIHSENGIFFRGQTTLHTIPRDPAVKGLLFGTSRREEPSLVTSAARTGFDYDALHFALRFFIEQRLFGKDGADAASSKRYQNWLKRTADPLCPIDYAIMALAQHYGLPSHGLDVTNDIDAAIWFATNKWSPGLPASYRTMQPNDWPTDPKRWPVVFACQQVTHSVGGMALQKCASLSEFDLEALRPRRQSAMFFLGGHSDHQNRLAETVVCAFRLKPAAWPTAATFDDFFPRPEHDSAYAALLSFAAVPEFSSLGSGVARYH